jgi:hypothetical protein
MRFLATIRAEGEVTEAMQERTGKPPSFFDRGTNVRSTPRSHRDTRAWKERSGIAPEGSLMVGYGRLGALNGRAGYRSS